MQFGAGWRLDVGSLFIGLLLGILLAIGFRRLWPVLSRWQLWIVARVRQSLAWMRSGAEVRFQAETAEYVQRHHLGREWATLDQVFEPPRILVPPRELDTSSLPDWGAGQFN